MGRIAVAHPVLAGAPREDYFETLAAIAGGLSLSEDELAEFYERHDNHWV